MRLFSRSQDDKKIEFGDIIDAIMIDVASLVLSTIVGVLYFLVTKPDGADPLNKLESRIDFLFSLMVTATIYLVIASLSRAISNIRLKKKIEAIDIATNYRNIARNAEHDLILKMYHMNHMDQLIGRLGISSVDRIVDSIKITDQKSGWSFPSQAIALESYVRFWSDLCRLQTESATKFVARLTHSTPLEIINETKYIELRENQGKFGKRGGEVFRVFIHRLKGSDDNVPHYLRVMNAIKEYGVKSVYVSDADGVSIPHEFIENDICIVSDKYYVVEWHIEGKRIALFSAITSEDRYRDYLRNWDVLLKAVKTFDYSIDINTSPYAQQLEQHRTEFFEYINKEIC